MRPALSFVLALAVVAVACTEPSSRRTAVGPGRFTQVTAGGGHACAVDTLRRAWCWGSNGVGAAGASIQDCNEIITSTYPGCAVAPAPINSQLRFQQLSAGRHHTCGITDSGAAYCWGSNAAGQLGTTTAEMCEATPCSATPVAVGGGLLFESIVAGYATTCGVTTTGVGKCWGTLLGPIAGAGTPSSTAVPTTIRVNGSGDSLWSSIARPGMAFACANDPGQTPFCWGDGNGGRLGNGTTGIQAPAPITSDVLLSGVAVGDYFACGLVADGRARCWGGSYGSTGGGNCSTATPIVCSATPLPVTGDYKFTGLSAGRQHICGVLSDRLETRCWGSDFDYAVGEGVPPFAVSVPYPVTGLHPFTSVSAGDQFSCGLTSDHNVWCWGSNRSGQLGQHPLEGRLISLFNARAPVVVAGTVMTIAN